MEIDILQGKSLQSMDQCTICHLLSFIAIMYRFSIKNKLSRSDNPQVEEKNDKIGFVYNP